MKETEIMTVQQVADFLQLNYYTVYRMVSSGILPASRVGRIWRINRKDVMEYLENQKKKR